MLDKQGNIAVSKLNTGDHFAIWEESGGRMNDLFFGQVVVEGNNILLFHDNGSYGSHLNKTAIRVLRNVPVLKEYSLFSEIAVDLGVACFNAKGIDCFSIVSEQEIEELSRNILVVGFMSQPINVKIGEIDLCDGNITIEKEDIGSFFEIIEILRPREGRTDVLSQVTAFLDEHSSDVYDQHNVHSLQDIKNRLLNAVNDLQLQPKASSRRRAK